MKFIPKKVRDQVTKFRKKVEGHLMDAVEVLTHNDWANTKAEALHTINTIFNRNEGGTSSHPLGRVSRKFREAEIEMMSDIWLPQEDREEIAIAGKQFYSSGVTRGSRLKSGSVSVLPSDLSPAATEEEAIQLVRSRKYKWVTKNGIICLDSIEEPTELRVIGDAVSVDRL